MYIIIMKKLINRVKTSFVIASTMSDLFLSGNFKNSRALDALNNHDILEAKLKRIGQEIDNQDHSDPIIIDFLSELQNTIIDKYSLDEVRARVHHQDSYQDCLEMLDTFFDRIQKKHPSHEGIEQIRVPFDILKRWYNGLDPEQQRFFERFERRISSNTTPYLSIRRNILTLKSTATVAIHEIKKIYPDMKLIH